MELNEFLACISFSGSCGGGEGSLIGCGSSIGSGGGVGFLGVIVGVIDTNLCSGCGVNWCRLIIVTSGMSGATGSID
jgi:hypothetical protein